MATSYSKYSPKGDMIWLILRPWILLPRVLYILLTLIFLLVRILFQGNSNSKSVQKNLSKYLFDVITDLGPCFIKLGQALSTRPDLVRQDWLTELTNLQDNLPPLNIK
jgi:predicted unusual protein kinase regulating ubiquinone biosynthesis (AarF/ABC1/UbiB family)